MTENEGPLLPANTGPKLGEEDVDFNADTFHFLVTRLVQYWDPEDFAASPLLSVLQGFIYWALTVAMQAAIAMSLLNQGEFMEASWENKYFSSTYNMTMAGASKLLYSGTNANMTLGNHSFAMKALKDVVVPNKSYNFTVVDNILDKCDATFGAHWQFYYIMAFLWLAKMFSEARSNLRLFRHIWRIGARFPDPNGDNKRYILKSKAEQEKTKHGNVVAGLDLWQKLILLLIAPVFKLCLTAGIAYAGLKFIILQNDEIKIVLKALCMGFVLDIDDVLFKLVTVATQQSVKQMKFRSRKVWGDNEGNPTNIWNSGLGGFVTLSALMIVVILLLRTSSDNRRRLPVFGDLMYFRMACRRYALQFYGEKAHRDMKTLAMLFGTSDNIFL